ncbi:MAG: glycosyltransferase family 39 protein [Phycisphaerae bacterium]|nr:glycosyltransferase family 39 protein [Phycisphaerae bacterium]
MASGQPAVPAGMGARRDSRTSGGILAPAGFSHQRRRDSRTSGLPTIFAIVLGGHRTSDAMNMAHAHTEETSAGRHFCYALVYCLLAVPVCLGWLGRTDVVSMEGIVADGARHMDRTGDYAVPRLYGRVYAYKPPLAYWLALASFKLLGRETEWTLRFPMAASGLLMGLGVFFILGRRIGPRTACMCALAALTGALVIQKVRVAEFDMPLAAGVGIAVAAACANVSCQRQSALLWMIGYGGLAFGCLAKGLPAVMAYAPGLLIAAVLTRTARQLLSPGHVIGLLFFVVPVGAWLWCAYQAQGGLVFEQPIREAMTRGLDWDWRSLGVTLGKPLVVAALFLPWSILLPITVSRRWRRNLDRTRRRLTTAAWSFLAVGTAAFMIVPADNPRYFLPLCVPLGILSGLAASADLRLLRRLDRARHVTAVVCAGAGAVSLLAVVGGIGDGQLPTADRVCLGLLACVVTAVLVAAIRRVGSASAAGLLVVTAISFWGIDATVVQPHRAQSRSLRSVAADFTTHLPDDITIWADVGDSYSSLFFYLRRPVNTFSIRTGRPPAGAYLVLLADQLPILDQRTDIAYAILHRASRGNREFLLATVRSP